MPFNLFIIISFLSIYKSALLLTIIARASSSAIMASNSTSTLFFLLLLPVLFVCVTPQQQKHSTQINLDSSISPRSPSSSWSSPSGYFQFGFYHEGSGFKIGIWLVGTEQNTVVWTANRDDPPVTSNAILSLDQNGRLLLRTEHGQKKIIANTTYSATSASMLDSGNFVLYNRSHIIWESFKYPTDTILGDQVLSAGQELFSSQSDTDHSTGRFHLKMQLDGNLVLYPINTDDSSIDAYWDSETFGNGFKFHLYLNRTGLLAIMNTSSSEMVSRLSLGGGGGSSSSENNQKVALYRATLDSDGIFRLYSHGVDDKNNGKVKEAVMVWKALKNPCEVQGFCGINSFCTIFDEQPNCLCIPGSDYVDFNQKTLGCLRNYTDEVCVDGKENITFYGMEKMDNILWGDIDYMEASMSMEECKNSCLEDCNCGAALFEQDDYGRDLCKKQKLPLRYVRRDFGNSISTTAFIKVSKMNETKSINGTNSVPTTELVPPRRTQQVITSKKVLIQILVTVIVFVIFSFVSLAISGIYVFKIRILRYKRLGEINGQMGLTGDEELIALRVFSYNELKKATDGFKEELGKGSFGAVYKGVLNRGRKLIAVKRLEKLIEEGEREFRAEMRAIGRTNHKNLVRLMGYCAEDSKRLLVYEYMSNGSLADLLFKQARRPDWDERVRIAIDVAKGINYLHEECKTPIIHCDVKPQNILMDDFWTAKISDFGLAKLLMPDQTRTFTGIRGTRGYLAPEWHKNTPISVKADVYSYGIVLLEIICCRRNLEMHVSNIDEIVLSNWIYKCFAGRELYKLVVGEDVDKKTLEKMVKVGLWCIQDEPVLRPSMKSVVLMLEGITDIASPPCPTSTSM